MIDPISIVQFISSAFKDQIEKQELEKFQTEFLQLQKADAESRRNKADADIRQLAKLRTEFIRFQYTYKLLIRKTKCHIPELDKYIKELTDRIKQAQFEKNRRH